MKKCKLDLLLLLAKSGALAGGVVVPASRLAQELGTGGTGASQQTVSRWLLQLQAEGLVQKTGRQVMVTEKGRKELEDVFCSIRDTLGKKAPAGGMEIIGKVTTGFREGRYYVSLPGYRRQLREKLGFSPYAGTLNIRLSRPKDVDAVRKLKHSEGIRTGGFERDGRTFGSAKCFPAVIGGKVRGAVIFPARTHYGDEIVEVLAPVSLRKKLGLRDGSEVSVRIKNIG